MKSYSLAVVMVVVSFTGLQAADVPKPAKPNILLILADDKY